MDKAYVIFKICGLIGLCFCGIMLHKNNVTGKNYNKILNAIYKYSLDQLNNGNLEDLTYLYDKIEPYQKTLYRLWDYGYKNIVPKDVFDKIEPYITQ